MEENRKKVLSDISMDFNELKIDCSRLQGEEALTCFDMAKGAENKFEREVLGIEIKGKDTRDVMREIGIEKVRY